MKLLKTTLVVLFVIILVLPIISYVGIVIANDTIADKIEKDLIEYKLPTNTQLVDSISIARKLVGNGNGMQYMGSILVESDLSTEELEEYYSSGFDYIEVRKQENAKLDFVFPDYSFNTFPETDEKSYYSVTCWDSGISENTSKFIIELLNFDIRGH